MRAPSDGVAQHGGLTRVTYQDLWFWFTGCIFDIGLACVASVFVSFGSKERPRNGIFGILPARKMGRKPKKKDGGRGGEGRKRLQTNSGLRTWLKILLG